MAFRGIITIICIISFLYALYREIDFYKRDHSRTFFNMQVAERDLPVLEDSVEEAIKELECWEHGTWSVWNGQGSLKEFETYKKHEIANTEECIRLYCNKISEAERVLSAGYSTYPYLRWVWLTIVHIVIVAIIWKSWLAVGVVCVAVDLFWILCIW